MMAPTLETPRLILRMMEPDDWPNYADYYTSERSASVGGPKSRSQTWQQFASFWGHWAIHGFGRFAVVERDTAQSVGHVGPYHPEGYDEPELSWTLWTNTAEGRGLAYEAATAARDWCYSALGWTTLTSLIDPANDRSIALAGRLGAAVERRIELEGYQLDLYRHPGPDA
ncbi:MAG: GNAT family N-acetyltransferase [Pseudomonadota bacterium]